MGKEDFVLVFDIGSSKIRAVKAGRGLNNTFNIKSEKTVEYDGFQWGFVLHEVIDFLGDVKHDRDADDQYDGEEECAQKFFDDIPVVSFQAYVIP